MTYTHYDKNDNEIIFEVEYEYEPEEKGTRWLPPSGGCITGMKVMEDGFDITSQITDELFKKIEDKCHQEIKEMVEDY